MVEIPNHNQLDQITNKKILKNMDVEETSTKSLQKVKKKAQKPKPKQIDSPERESSFVNEYSVNSKEILQNEKTKRSIKSQKPKKIYHSPLASNK